MNTLTDGVRIKRASNNSGTTFQEVTWKFTDSTPGSWDWDFTKNFKVDQTISGVTIATKSRDTLLVLSGATYVDSLVNTERRIYTFKRVNNNNYDGFGYGASVGTSTGVTSNAWYQRDNAGGLYRHVFPYTEVYVRQ